MNLVLVFIYFFNPNYAEVGKSLSASYLNDARISYANGDLYRSYKLYTYLYENDKDVFYKSAASDYIKLVNELSSNKRFQQVCNILTRTNDQNSIYQCGYEFYRNGKYDISLSYLKKITDVNLQSKSKILKASIYLAQDRPSECLKVLDTHKRAEIEDLQFLTRARCLALQRNYNDAVVAYQSIESRSSYYLDSIIELAWVFFKLRNRQQVDNAVKVIEATYSKNNPTTTGATTRQFFDIKYIQAYLDLVLFGGGKSESRFKSLIKEIETYKDNFIIGDKDLQKTIDSVYSANTYLGLKRNQDFQQTFNHLSQWVSLDLIRQINNNIRLIIATNRELERFNSNIYSDNLRYKTAIEELNQHSRQDLRTSIQLASTLAHKTMGGEKLKAHIGIVDLSNLAKTEGLKSLDEATEIYKEKESNLIDKLGVSL